MSAESGFDRYKRERPLYERFSQVVLGIATEACRRAGIRCALQWRAKTLDGLTKKLMIDPQLYDEVFDKAGVRIIPSYPDERDAVAQVVRSTFDVKREKDSLKELDPSTFEYRGLHFIVAISERERPKVAQELWPLVAELQVHTPGESIWANVSHDLFYKSRIAKDMSAHRAMNRLSAVLELVDISMANLRQELLRGTGADVARMIDVFERDFLRLRGRQFNEPLTLEFVETLRPLVGEIEQFLRDYEQFVGKNEPKLEHVFKDEYDDFRHILLGQPESLLVFYLLDHDRPGLENKWPSRVPTTALDGIRDVWVPS
jgi:ppGpp synthetase/RelA/SpoT-type nucleotidyltranferase